MRAPRAFGRTTLVVTTLTFIAMLAWIAPPASDGPPRAASQPTAVVMAPAPPRASGATTSNKPQVSASSPAGAGGRIVAIDPETGQIGTPTAEQLRGLELAGLRQATPATDPVLRETRLGNGTVILHLDGRFEDHALARTDRNGRVTYGCAHDVHGPALLAADSTSSRGLEVE